MLHTALSIPQAQKIVLQLQSYSNTATRKKPDLLACIEQIGYVQIDSISVVARAHHHCLFNRVHSYKEQHLEDLLTQRKVFEYWAHAAAYLPIKDYRYSLLRKQNIKKGTMHWYKPDLRVMAHVLARIEREGPLLAKDFKQTKHTNSGWWDWKPAKIALEQLFMQGDLMVTQRRGFQKVYDLTQRVLPSGIDTSTPTQSEFCRHQILQYLKSNGLAKIEHICYLRKGIKRDVELELQRLMQEQLITKVHVKEHSYYALFGVEELLKTRLSQEKVRILSPFDNLLIQRARMRELFNFDYQIECYLPAAKRKYGYFSLPVLQGQHFVGRMDVKVHRKEQAMQVLHLHLETLDLDKLCQPLVLALREFMLFQQVTSIAIERVSHCDDSFNRASLEQFRRSVCSML